MQISYRHLYVKNQGVPIMAGFPAFLGVSTLSAAQGVFLRGVLLLELGMMHSAMVCSTSKPHPSGCLLRSARSTVAVSLF